MHNAASDASATPTVQQGGAMPQLLIVTTDSLQANISLIAPTEGVARFIAGSPAITDAPERGIPDALARLAEQCGFALSEEMIRAVVTSGAPIAVHVVGERDVTDAAALAIAERFGLARIVGEPIIPPRNPARDRTWYQRVTDAWQQGRIEALLVIVPSGVLPLWAAQLLNALGDMPSPGEPRCIVLASDSDLAAALPTDAILISRDDHLASHLVRTLNRLRAARLLPRLPDDAPILSRPEALAVAIRAVSVEYGMPAIYLDVADGTTVIIVDEDRTDVHHLPELDFSRGVIRLLNRCEPEDITRWVSFSADRQSLRTWAMGRVSRSTALLVSDEDRAVAAAFVRAALRLILAKIAQPIPNGALWLLGPSIARLGSPEAALRIVADLMPSVRVAVVACDNDDLIAAVGALTASYPVDASSLLAHDAFVSAGSVIQVPLTGGRSPSAITATLANGERTSMAEVTPDALTTIGWNGDGTLSLSGSPSPVERIVVHGGPGGIVIDRRRRPLIAVAPKATRPSVSGRLRPGAVAK